MNDLKYNYLPENAFVLNIDVIPNVSFYCQEVSIPQITTDSIDIPFYGTNHKVQNNSTDFGVLDVTFILDEGMLAYEELFRWVVAQNPNSSNPLNDKYIGLVSEATVHITTANSTANRTFQFTGLFPVSVGTLNFRTTMTDVQYLTCTASFAYTIADIK